MLKFDSVEEFLDIQYPEHKDRILSLAFKKYNLEEFIKLCYVPELDQWKGFDGNRFYCLNAEQLLAGRGRGTRGKKREEHSKIMKIKMKVVANNRSDEHKKNLEYFLKNNYKQKRLINKGIIDSLITYNKEEIDLLYSEFISNLQKSESKKNKQCLRWLNGECDDKYINLDIYIDWVNKWKNKDIDESCFSELMSIISTVAIKDNNNNMGITPKFIRDNLSGFKYNLDDAELIKVKSSWEEDAIIFFEENKIYWSYEPITISINDINTTQKNYTPDFKVILDDEIWYIEIKGYIRDKKHKENINICNIAASKYFDNFSYITKKISSIEDIKNNKI